MAKEERKIEAAQPVTGNPASGGSVAVVDRWFADHFHGCSHPWFTTEIYNHIYSAAQDLKARLEKEA